MLEKEYHKQKPEIKYVYHIETRTIGVPSQIVINATQSAIDRLRLN